MTRTINKIDSLHSPNLSPKTPQDERNMFDVPIISERIHMYDKYTDIFKKNNKEPDVDVSAIEKLSDVVESLEVQRKRGKFKKYTEFINDDNKNKSPDILEDSSTEDKSEIQPYKVSKSKSFQFMNKYKLDGKEMSIHNGMKMIKSRSVKSFRFPPETFSGKNQTIGVNSGASKDTSPQNVKTDRIVPKDDELKSHESGFEDYLTNILTRADSKLPNQYPSKQMIDFFAVSSVDNIGPQVRDPIDDAKKNQYVKYDKIEDTINSDPYSIQSFTSSVDRSNDLVLNYTSPDSPGSNIERCNSPKPQADLQSHDNFQFCSSSHKAQSDSHENETFSGLFCCAAPSFHADKSNIDAELQEVYFLGESNLGVSSDTEQSNLSPTFHLNEQNVRPRSEAGSPSRYKKVNLIARASRSLLGKNKF